MNTTFIRINVSLWMENNCTQCWNCANIEGSDIFLHDGKYIRLPECRVADRYMTEVYHNPCNSYIPFGGNDMAKTGLYNFTAECNKLLKHNPGTKKKLHFLGYDNPELVKQKLKEIERK